MKITRDKTELKRKHGVNIWVYPVGRDEAGVAYVEVDGGHYQEFYDKKSTFLYYVIGGQGTFYLNGKKTSTKATDLVVAPPLTKIYYLGKMKMILVTVPAWKPENEIHVRFITKRHG